MTPFKLPIKILFQHCDPAGIVFYPRYFEMINQTVEEWFETGLGYSFAVMQTRDAAGVPTVTITADFSAPSRLGEVVDFSLHLTKLGRSSADVVIEAACAGELRLTARKTLVYMDKATGRPMPWRDDLRPIMERYLG